MHWIVPRALTHEQAQTLALKARAAHHGDEDGHVSTHKTDFLPLTAFALNKCIVQMKFPHKIDRVDPLMKLYRLDDSSPAVPLHRDESFDGPGGTYARYSVLVKLSADYEGGETIIEGKKVSLRLGDAVVFHHSARHEGRAVKTGVKHILKTDLFCEGP